MYLYRIFGYTVVLQYKYKLYSGTVFFQRVVGRSPKPAFFKIFMHEDLRFDLNQSCSRQ